MENFKRTFYLLQLQSEYYAIIHAHRMTFKQLVNATARCGRKVKWNIRLHTLHMASNARVSACDFAQQTRKSEREREPKDGHLFLVERCFCCGTITILYCITSSIIIVFFILKTETDPTDFVASILRHTAIYIYIHGKVLWKRIDKVI